MKDTKRRRDELNELTDEDQLMRLGLDPALADVRDSDQLRAVRTKKGAEPADAELALQLRNRQRREHSAICLAALERGVGLIEVARTAKQELGGERGADVFLVAARAAEARKLKLSL
jgi:hypothetical protein